MTYDVVQIDVPVDTSASDTTVLRESAQAAFDAGYNPDDYDVIARRTSDRGNFAWFFTKDTFLRRDNATTTVHEMGHCMGLQHANWWNVDNGEPAWSENGVNQLYAEDFDAMSNSPRGDFNAHEKRELDWLSGSDYADNVADGVYRIYPYDSYQGNFNSSGVDGAYYLVTVYKDSSTNNGGARAREYVLSIRNQPEKSGTNNSPWFAEGLLLHWKPWTYDGSSGFNNNGAFGTSLVDTNVDSDDGGALGQYRPGKDAKDQYDAPILIGETYIDNDPDNRDGNIYITPLRKTDPDGVPRSGDEYVDVKIVRGDQSGNQMPSAGWTLSSTTVEPGGSITATVNATDADDTELGYLWDFGLGTDGAARRAMPLNGNSTQTFTYDNEGTYTLSCIVTDGRGGTFSLQQTITVSNDADMDGLSDSWEMLYFGDLDEGPNDDPDNDGDDNLTELTNGTDPTINEALQPPAAPTGLAASSSNNSVTLDWDDNTEDDFSSYNAYRSTTMGTYGSALINVTSSEHVDDTAVNDITYYYVVKAVDTDSNKSAASDEVSVTPAPITSTQVTASDNSWIQANELTNVKDASETIFVQRNDWQFGSKEGFLRFEVSGDDEFGQVPVDAIQTVTLDLFMTANIQGDTLQVYALLDGAQISGSNLSESTWTGGTDGTEATGGNLTAGNRPDGPGTVPDAKRTMPKTGYTTILLGSITFPDGSDGNALGLQQITISEIDLFKDLINNDTNSEVTFILTGVKKSGANRFASVFNTSGNPVPALSITAPDNSNNDNDDDGIDDDWEILHFGSSGGIDGSLDSDGDGIADFFEYLYGSDPTSTTSKGFQMQAGSNSDGSNAMFDWGVNEGFVLGVDYTIDISTDLSTWDPMPQEHYTINEITSDGKTQLELEITHDYGANVFIRLVQPTP